MAVNIDLVHTLVYNIASKQLSAFPSPNDFNSYANLANIDLFNYYNDEREKMLLRVKQGETLIIPAVLSTFIKFNVPLSQISNVLTQPNDFIYDQALSISPSVGVSIDIKKVDYDKLSNYITSTIDNPTFQNPIYIELADTFQVFPTVTNVSLTYLGLPPNVSWNYTLVGNRPVYDPLNSIDFIWSETEFYRLSARILKYMGISIRDQELEEFAMQMEQGAS